MSRRVAVAVLAVPFAAVRERHHHCAVSSQQSEGASNGASDRVMRGRCIHIMNGEKHLFSHLTRKTCKKNSNCILFFLDAVKMI